MVAVFRFCRIELVASTYSRETRNNVQAVCFCCLNFATLNFLGFFQRAPVFCCRELYVGECALFSYLLLVYFYLFFPLLVYFIFATFWFWFIFYLCFCFLLRSIILNPKNWKKSEKIQIECSKSC